MQILPNDIYSTNTVTDDGGNNTEAIVGGIVGGIVAAIIIIIIIIIIVFYCMKKKRERTSRLRPSKEDVYTIPIHFIYMCIYKSPRHACVFTHKCL